MNLAVDDCHPKFTQAKNSIGAITSENRLTFAFFAGLPGGNNRPKPLFFRSVVQFRPMGDLALLGGGLGPTRVAAPKFSSD
jgi:hypothetical protein